MKQAVGGLLSIMYRKNWFLKIYFFLIFDMHINRFFVMHISNRKTKTKKAKSDFCLHFSLCGTVLRRQGKINLCVFVIALMQNIISIISIINGQT